MCTINENHMMYGYDVWLLKYEAQQTEFFVILDGSLPFYPPNNPENQNFEKMKNKSLEILSLYKNDNHMMYGS